MRDLDSGFERIDNVPQTWKVFVLKWYDKQLNNAKKLCPETVSILEKCKTVKAAMFSILEPGKYIPPHKGPFAGCLRYHLGFLIPNDTENCWIEVNGEKKSWKDGETFIFDDTYTHSVFNNTDEIRIVLFMDILRPSIFPFNHINKIFGKIVRCASRRLNDVSEKQVYIDSKMESKFSPSGK